MINKIVKRSGKVVEFDSSRIAKAMKGALIASKTAFTQKRIDEMERDAVALLENEYEKDGIVTVENAQDCAEKVLMLHGHYDAAKAFILYRQRHSDVREITGQIDESVRKFGVENITDTMGAVDVVEFADPSNNNEMLFDSIKNQNASTQNGTIGYSVLETYARSAKTFWTQTYDPDIIRRSQVDGGKGEIYIHDMGWVGGYCSGWSLKDLLLRGLSGVPNKIASAPAKHLSTLCNQMVNFLGILQNEWAGAQAFSSFDTYLAPFVKKDNLSYKEVKQCVQSFIYGVNTPSRWGCVLPSTEILTETGWKHYKDLEKGEMIYTWKNGALELCPLNEIVVKEHHGVLHQYKARGYNQTVTPEHRVLCKKHNLDQYMIRHSADIFDVKTPYYFPAQFHGSNIVAQEKGITEAEAAFAAIVYTDGSIEIRGDSVHKVVIYKSPNREGNEEIEELSKILGLTFTVKEIVGGFNSPVNKYSFYGDSARTIVKLVGTTKKVIDPKFTRMDADRSEVFLQTWSRYDGNDEKFRLQYDNDDIADALQHIAVRAGHTSFRYHGKRANYIKIRGTENIQPASRTEIPYEGIVWCPNDDNGTAVFRSADGEVFISGQCQAPFTNVTIDWTCPPDMKDTPAIVGGKEMDFTYGDCKKEMDMVNKAFIEVMVEGDDDGRGFQYPIPTYSITKDFDWSDTENNRLLFEMAAKYGTPYFSNYINSDMNPSDVRSMCPLFGKEKVLVRDDYSKEFHVSTVENLFKEGKKEKVYEVVLNGETKRARLNRFDNQKFYTVKTINGFSVVLSGTHANLVYGNTVKRTDELTTADYLPFNVVPLEGNGLTFDDGLMVGAFLGDGSLKDDYAVTYSVNGTTKTGIMSDIIRIAEDKFGAKVTVDNLGNCINVVVTSKMLRGLIEEYVTGKALNKELNVKCIGKSMSFREGILSGYMQTDGGTKNRMYSASKAAVESVATMLMSMGIPSKISVDNRDSETTLSDNPIYSIRPYDVENGQKSYGDVYIKGDGYMWFRIESIEEADTTSAIGYCFEVLNDEEPYFTLPCGLVTHNCRLRLDLRELRKQNGGNFGAGENTGSIGVVTINLPQIAYTSTTEEEFFTELELAMNAAARSLDIKRRVVNAYLNKPQSAYPYTKAYLDAGLNNHFSTIGLVGMNEACLNAKWIGKDLTHQESLDWANRVLDFMREKLSDYQEMYGCLFNLEATPAESTCHTLARIDRRNYPSIITAGGKGAAPYYTNSTHLPVGAIEDVFDALDMEDPMQVKYTSGTVFHAFLGERLPDWKSAAKLVKTIAENYRLPYFTLSPTYSVCADHGYISGEESTCPVCGKKTEVYSRITGYYRPVSNWNDGKAQEFKDRKTYCVDEDGKKHGIELETVADEACTAETATAEDTGAAENTGDGVVILSTHTCPKCKMAKAKMDAKGIAYESLFAEDEAGAELAKKLDVSAVPVMIVRKDGEEKVLRDFIEIMNWIG